MTGFCRWMASRKRHTSITSPNDPLRHRFTGREMRPAPDDIGLLLTPFEICILDDGFVEPHGFYTAIPISVRKRDGAFAYPK